MIFKDFETCQDLIALDPNDKKLGKELARLFPLVHAIKRQAFNLGDREPVSFMELCPGHAIVSKMLHKSYPQAIIKVLDSDNRMTLKLRETFNWMDVHYDEIIPVHAQHRAVIIHHNGLLQRFGGGKTIDILKSHATRCRAMVFQVPISGHPPIDGVTHLLRTVDDWKGFFIESRLHLLEYGVVGIDARQEEAYFICQS